MLRVFIYMRYQRNRQTGWGQNQRKINTRDIKETSYILGLYRKPTGFKIQTSEK